VKEISYATLGSLPFRLAVQVRLQLGRLALIAMVCGLAGMIFATAGRAQESQATPQSSPRANTAPPPQSLTAPVLLPPSSLIPHEQVRAGEAQVTFDGKQLTIVANNSTLSDILEAVRASTGAEIDVPTGAAGEPLAEVRLGPGPAREVLASLLSWTNFGYIIQGSDKNPLGIQSVVLVVRTKAPAGGASSPGALASQSRNRAAPEPEPIPVVIPPPVNPVPPPEPVPSVDVAPLGLEQQPVHQTLEAPPNPQQFRTTDQMVRELQNMYQQRLQMQNVPPSPTAIKPNTPN
jgi:hypothetical protein